MPSLLERDPRPEGSERGGLQRRDLSLRADTARDDDRSLMATISTDAPVVIRDHATRDLIEETLVAGGGQFAPHVPILGAHRHYHELDVYGHVEDHREVAGGYESRLFFSEEANANDPVAIVWKRVRGGHLKGVSIGYEPLEFTDIAAGKTARVGGRSYTAGSLRLRVTRSYLIYEVSVVPIGADPNALMQARRLALQNAPAPTRRRRLTNPPPAGPARRRQRNV